MTFLERNSVPRGCSTQRLSSLSRHELNCSRITHRIPIGQRACTLMPGCKFFEEFGWGAMLVEMTSNLNPPRRAALSPGAWSIAKNPTASKPCT
jgi:hypothetical protein